MMAINIIGRYQILSPRNSANVQGSNVFQKYLKPILSCEKYITQSPPSNNFEMFEAFSKESII